MVDDSGAVPRRTWWNVRRGDERFEFSSAKGRTLAVGDLVNMPPPVPHGAVWRVIAIEPPETEGYDGTLVLEFVQLHRP